MEEYIKEAPTSQGDVKRLVRKVIYKKKNLQDFSMYVNKDHSKSGISRK